jgi:hypothetical protein
MPSMALPQVYGEDVIDVIGSMSGEAGTDLYIYGPQLSRW